MRYRVVPVTPFQQNAGLVWCEQTMRGAVVDPGGDLDRILAAVEQEGITLERVLITHGHIDHAGAAADLAERFGIPIEGPHRDDAYWIENLDRQGQMFGLPGGRAFTPDRWLDQGDTVTVGSLVLDVLYCPGHTPGHIAFHHAPSRIALVGDVLFHGSIGRTDFPGGDFDALMRSIHERLLPLGDDVTFIPGHGPISTIGEERRTNPFLTNR